MGGKLKPGSLRAIEAAELLEAMACVYPGDPTGSMMRDAAALRGVEYQAPEVVITFGEDSGRAALAQGGGE